MKKIYIRKYINKGLIYIIYLLFFLIICIIFFFKYISYYFMIYIFIYIVMEEYGWIEIYDGKRSVMSVIV